MLAQAERQSQTDGIQELGPLQNQITPPNNRPKVMLDNLREQVVQGDKAPIRMVEGRSLPCGTARKNSLRSSKEGASTTSLKGLAET
jgi:hypothetical protein